MAEEGSDLEVPEREILLSSLKFESYEMGKSSTSSVSSHYPDNFAARISKNYVTFITRISKESFREIAKKILEEMDESDEMSSNASSSNKEQSRGPDSAHDVSASSGKNPDDSYLKEPKSRSCIEDSVIEDLTELTGKDELQENEVNMEIISCEIEKISTLPEVSSTEEGEILDDGTRDCVNFQTNFEERDDSSLILELPCSLEPKSTRIINRNENQSEDIAGKLISSSSEEDLQLLEQKSTGSSDLARTENKDEISFRNISAGRENPVAEEKNVKNNFDEIKWPIIDRFTDIETISMKEVKTYEAQSLITKYLKLELPNECIMIKISADVNNISVNAVKYQNSSTLNNIENAKIPEESTASTVSISQDLSKIVATFLDEIGEINGALEISMKRSIDSSVICAIADAKPDNGDYETVKDASSLNETGTLKKCQETNSTEWSKKTTEVLEPAAISPEMNASKSESSASGTKEKIAEITSDEQVSSETKFAKSPVLQSALVTNTLMKSNEQSNFEDVADILPEQVSESLINAENKNLSIEEGNDLVEQHIAEKEEKVSEYLPLLDKSRTDSKSTVINPVEDREDSGIDEFVVGSCTETFTESPAGNNYGGSLSKEKSDLMFPDKNELNIKNVSMEEIIQRESNKEMSLDTGISPKISDESCQILNAAYETSFISSEDIRTECQTSSPKKTDIKASDNIVSPESTESDETKRNVGVEDTCTGLLKFPCSSIRISSKPNNENDFYQETVEDSNVRFSKIQETETSSSWKLGIEDESYSVEPIDAEKDLSKLKQTVKIETEKGEDTQKQSNGTKNKFSERIQAVLDDSYDSFKKIEEARENFATPNTEVSENLFDHTYVETEVSLLDESKLVKVLPMERETENGENCTTENFKPNAEIKIFEACSSENSENGQTNNSNGSSSSVRMKDEMNADTISEHDTIVSDESTSNEGSTFESDVSRNLSQDDLPKSAKSKKRNLKKVKTVYGDEVDGAQTRNRRCDVSKISEQSIPEDPFVIKDGKNHHGFSASRRGSGRKVSTYYGNLLNKSLDPAQTTSKPFIRNDEISSFFLMTKFPPTSATLMERETENGENCKAEKSKPRAQIKLSEACSSENSENNSNRSSSLGRMKDEMNADTISEHDTIVSDESTSVEGSTFESDVSRNRSQDDLRKSEESKKRNFKKVKTVYGDEVDSAPTRNRRYNVSKISEQSIPEDPFVIKDGKNHHEFSASHRGSGKKVSTHSRNLLSKSLNPAQTTSKLFVCNDETSTNSVSAARKKRAETLDVKLKNEVKSGVRSSPRKLAKSVSSAAGESSKTAKISRSGVDALSKRGD